MSAVPMRVARIDLGAITANVRILRDLVAPAQLMAVVKADAYGHGAAPVARAAIAGGADWLGVADLGEARALRVAGVDHPLLAWLHGDAADFAGAVADRIDLGISSLAQLDRAAAAGNALGPVATVQLKLDTGLSRNGIAPEDAGAVFARAAEHERAGRLRVRGLMSHLSNTSRHDNARQAALLDDLVASAHGAGLAPDLVHVAASEAALTAPELRHDLVRTGIAMYGLPPADGIDLAGLGIRPAMTLAGTVAAIRRIPAGAGVSYGYTHRATHATTLALIPLGYADGVPRAASGRAEVLIGGTRFANVGRIAMDQFLVDVGDEPVAVGDEVVLWGDPATGAPSAEDWAEAAGTIGYEIVTRVGPRVPREYV